MSAYRCPQAHLRDPHSTFASCVLCSHPGSATPRRHAGSFLTTPPARQRARPPPARWRTDHDARPQESRSFPTHTTHSRFSRWRRGKHLRRLKSGRFTWRETTDDALTHHAATARAPPRPVAVCLGTVAPEEAFIAPEWLPSASIVIGGLSLMDIERDLRCAPTGISRPSLAGWPREARSKGSRPARSPPRSCAFPCVPRMTFRAVVAAVSFCVQIAVQTAHTPLRGNAQKAAPRRLQKED